jgi:hypothetical protein
MRMNNYLIIYTCIPSGTREKYNLCRGEIFIFVFVFVFVFDTHGLRLEL